MVGVKLVDGVIFSIIDGGLSIILKNKQTMKFHKNKLESQEY
jgi:hypothetical protein